MTIRLKAALVAGVSLNVIGGFFGAAWAGEAIATAPSADAPAPAAASESGAATVTEVIVTAERRSMSVQKVPMTVQAFTGETLSNLNIETLDDLLRYTPNVTYGSNGSGQGAIYMRGLSSGFRGNQSSATVSDFPNVAIYLDEQSMQFPARNIDIYMVDMERVEVLEGPQGALFGGGAEAGAVRYITNKPKLNTFEGNAEGEYGFTSGGDNNYRFTGVMNIPLIHDKLAVRVVAYDERQGGYINNEPSTFTRSNADPGNNAYFGIAPTNTPNGPMCPNGKPAYTAPGATGPNNCTLPGTSSVNNYALAQRAWNPTEYQGGRVEALYKINPDWDILISESFGNLDAEGMGATYPIGSDFQQLQPMQVTAFSPAYSHDKYLNSAWTVNGKIGDIKVLYSGGWTNRHISEQMDYTNYSRSGGGIEYECTGPGTAYYTTQTTLNQCYSPIAFWNDQVRNTHMSHEIRASSPDSWRLRFVAGAYYEDFHIYDNMNFSYKTIPACNPANLLAAAGSTTFVCLGDIQPAANTGANDPRVRPDLVGFGEDTQRGYTQTAIFGSVDYDIIPHVLTVTAGTRWYDYSEFETGSQYNMSGAAVDVALCGTNCQVNISSHNDHVKYTGFKSRAGLTWHPNSSTTVYYLFSQGFRPGGFNRSNSKEVLDLVHKADPQFLEPNGYAPDSLNNHEIGFKTTLLDHRLQLNLSAYYMDWNSVQFFLFAPVYGINTTFGINGPSYNVKGVEAQFVGRVNEHLTIQGSGSYNHDTVSQAPCLVDNVDSTGYPTSLPNNQGAVPKGQCIKSAYSKSAGATAQFINPFGAVGDTPAFSPDFQGNIRARYDWSIGEYKAHVMVGGNYVGQMSNQPASYLSGAQVLVPTTTYLRYTQPAYGMIDASIGIAKDKWYAEIYGTNLNDSHASTFTSSAQFIKSEVPLRPTVIMMKFGFKY
jgi:outer membrane receptor protein involved in Fe transport